MNDTIYSLTSEDYTKFNISSIDLNSGVTLNQMPTANIDSSLIGFNFASGIRKFNDNLYFNLQNSYQSDWTALAVYLKSMTDITVKPIPFSRLTHLTHNIHITENEYILFRDSVGDSKEILDIFTMNGNLIKTQSLPFPKSSISIRAITQNKGITTCLISFDGNQLINDFNSKKYLHCLLKIDSLGNIFDYRPVAQYFNGVHSNVYYIYKMAQFDDGYYSIYFTPTPGVPRTPRYFAVVDSSLNINGNFFLESFYDTTVSHYEFNNLESKFKVYPNPTTTQLNISTKKTTPTFYTLYSITGKQIQNGSFSTQTQLDVSHLPKGLYFLKLENESGAQTKKIIKQ